MAVKALGTRLFYAELSSGDPEWVQIARVKNINPPGGERNNIESVALEDTIVRNLGGILRNGEMETTIEFSPTRAAELYGLNDGDDRTWAIVFRDNSYLEFDGYVKAFGWEEIGEDGLLINNMTTQVAYDVELQSGWVDPE